VLRIPPLDLIEQYKKISDEVNTAVLGVLASGQYINGSPVQQFEAAFAHYIGASHCVSCNSGTDALFLALRALNIGRGDEVITSPFTFIATAEMISAVGATPIFVDIDPQTFNLNVSQIEAAITPRTRAIMPVHLFGQPVEMSQVMAIAQAHQLWVIEDCAQAVGASWNGTKVGAIGHIGCFSFYPTKNLGACGDGGAVTTQDETIAMQIRMLREHGSKERYYHDEIGINSRLDGVQAAILQIKLRYLDEWNIQRQRVAYYYHERLQLVPGIQPPDTHPSGKHVWNQYTLRLLEARPGDRDRLRQALHLQGIGSMVYYPLPLHLQPVYQGLGYQPGQLAIAEQCCHEVLSLPMFPELTEKQQDYVIDGLKTALTQ